jgi:hypothetical protein
MSMTTEELLLLVLIAVTAIGVAATTIGVFYARRSSIAQLPNPMVGKVVSVGGTGMMQGVNIVATLVNQSTALARSVEVRALAAGGHEEKLSVTYLRDDGRDDGFAQKKLAYSLEPRQVVRFRVSGETTYDHFGAHMGTSEDPVYFPDEHRRWIEVRVSLEKPSGRSRTRLSCYQWQQEVGELRRIRTPGVLKRWRLQQLFRKHPPADEDM